MFFQTGQLLFLLLFTSFVAPMSFAWSNIMASIGVSLFSIALWGFYVVVPLFEIKKQTNFRKELNQILVFNLIASSVCGFSIYLFDVYGYIACISYLPLIVKSGKFLILYSDEFNLRS